MSVEWRVVPTSDGSYEATACGRVRRIRKNGTALELRPSGVDRYGFARVNVTYGTKGKIRKRRIMTMVGLAWVPQPSADDRYVFPLDGDPSNASAGNIGWKDHSVGRKSASRKHKGFGGQSTYGRKSAVSRLLAVLTSLTPGMPTTRAAVAASAGSTVASITPVFRFLRQRDAVTVDGNGYVLAEAGRLMIPQLYECVRERALLHALRLGDSSGRGQVRRKIPQSVRYDVLAIGSCELCGAEAGDNVKLTVDHIVPVAAGGTNERENLQALCWLCNMGKSDKLAA